MVHLPEPIEGLVHMAGRRRGRVDAVSTRRWWVWESMPALISEIGLLLELMEDLLAGMAYHKSGVEQGFPRGRLEQGTGRFVGGRRQGTG